MKLVLESTDLIVQVNGAPARAWRGRTGVGVEVVAYVAVIQVAKDHDATELERELQELAPPSGICRVCGCSDNHCCADDYGFTCAWADDTHTLCTGCAL